MNLKDRLLELKESVIALSLAQKDPRTPFIAKCVIFVTLLYALSPIDLIPDFIPVLGLLDDLIIIPLGVFLAIKLIPPGVWAECKERSSTISKHNVHFNPMLGAVMVLGVWASVVSISYRLYLK